MSLLPRFYPYYLEVVTKKHRADETPDSHTASATKFHTCSVLKAVKQEENPLKYRLRYRNRRDIRKQREFLRASLEFLTHRQWSSPRLLLSGSNSRTATVPVPAAAAVSITTFASRSQIRPQPRVQLTQRLQHFSGGIQLPAPAHPETRPYHPHAAV
ncbi:hypothetical protein BC830DRAFT_1084278 [Chytriomyces sp. MP71]|nr:hypothetical protein BC830DRAFT_1084278 [Chytriomyces sp. MP71]